MSDSTEQSDPPCEASGGRWRLEILSWDLALSVRMSTHTPPEYRFLGGLNYVRSLVLKCRVVTSRAWGGRDLEVWVSPFGPEMTFGAGDDDLDEVGRVYLRPREHPDRPHARLMLPAQGHAVLATALASVTKYLLIETFGATTEEEKVFGFYFSATLPR